jgi:murein DD-endopeptidase MepM/ murein hydrolase activator NlpD
MARWRRGALFGLVVVLQGAAVPAAAFPLEPVDQPGSGSGLATGPAASSGWARDPFVVLGRAAPRPLPVAPAGGWQWPLEPSPAVVRRFQPPPTPWSAGHRGVDLLAHVGQPVLAAGPGVVSFSGDIAGVGVVSVAHAGGLRTTYEPVRARVPTGVVVRAGDQIGAVDAGPGHCAPITCLHWGLIHGGGGAMTYLDPLSVLALGPPVLLRMG